jgi:hypothetical protein
LPADVGRGTVVAALRVAGDIEEVVFDAQLLDGQVLANLLPMESHQRDGIPLVLFPLNLPPELVAASGGLAEGAR